jgi:phosphocarrier protein NPr
MSLSPLNRTVLVANPEGLHARAALLVRELAQRYHARVELIKGPLRVDAVDVLQMLSLCAEQGDELVLEASGEEAQAVLDALEQLFARKFETDDLSRRPES